MHTQPRRALRAAPGAAGILQRRPAGPPRTSASPCDQLTTVLSRASIISIYHPAERDTWQRRPRHPRPVLEFAGQPFRAAERCCGW